MSIKECVSKDYVIVVRKGIKYVFPRSMMNK